MLLILISSSIPLYVGPTLVSTFSMSQVNIGPRLNATLSQAPPPNDIFHA